MSRAKVTNEEIECRRELIRIYMARGITRPRQLLDENELKERYDIYKNPYPVLRHDIEIIRKENNKVLVVIGGDEVLGDYRVAIEELICTTWAALDKIAGTGNPNSVNLLIKTLSGLYKDYSRIMGVDIDKLDSQKILNLKGRYNRTMN